MRLDHREGSRLTFDAVDADFFDRLPPVDGIGAWAEFSSEAPVFVVEVEYSRFRRSLRCRDHFFGGIILIPFGGIVL